MEKSFQIWNWYWWSHRFALSTLLASVVIAQAVFWLMSSSTWVGAEATAGVVLVFSALAGTLISISVFSSGGNLDLTAGQSAFPKWLTLLPVSSQMLATIPVCGMLATLAWSWIPFALAMRVLFPTLTIFGFVLLPWVFLASVATWIQALSWCPFRSGWHRLGTLLVLVATYLLLLLVGDLIADWFVNAVIVVMFAGGTAAAYFGLVSARLQEPSTKESSLPETNKSSQLSLVSQVSGSSVDSTGSKTVLAALFWRDWHQIARIVVGIMGLVSAGVLALVVSGHVSERLIILFPFVPTLLMSTTGINFGKDAYFKPHPSMPTFLAALPISNRDYLSARLKVCFATSCMVWLISLLPLLVWLCMDGNLNEVKSLVVELQSGLGMTGGQEWRTLIVFLAFSAFTAVTSPYPSMVLGLCGRARLETVVISVLGGIGFALVLLICWGFANMTDGMKDPDGLVKFQAWLTGLVPWVLGGLMVVKLSFAVIAFHLAYKRSLAKGIDSVLRYARLFVIAVLVVSFFVVVTPTGMHSKSNILMVAFWCFPLGSLFLADFALDWNRHR